jgi:hypothetical protein
MYYPGAPSKKKIENGTMIERRNPLKKESKSRRNTKRRERKVTDGQKWNLK